MCLERYDGYAGAISVMLQGLGYKVMMIIMLMIMTKIIVMMMMIMTI